MRSVSLLQTIDTIHAERWLSGRRRSPGKWVNGLSPFQGFKSLPLRHFYINLHRLCFYPEGWPSGRRRATRNRLGGAELSRGFKSHPLRQKTKYWQYEYHFMRRVVREVYGERLEAVCGDEPPEVQILYSPPFFSFNIFQFYKNPLNKEQQPKNHSISQ